MYQYNILLLTCSDPLYIICFVYLLLIVVGQERETEAIKMMSVKGGLLDHSRAWLALSQKSSIFAEAQKVL